MKLGWHYADLLQTSVGLCRKQDWN